MIRSDNIKKGVLMSKIKLESVGTIVDDVGLCYPMYKDGTPDLDNPQFIMDTENDEWWETMSCEEAVRLFQFLAETDMYLEQDYFKWAQEMMAVVVESKGFVDITAARLHEGWSI